MKNRTVLGLALLLLVQSMSAAIYVLPEEYENNLEMESLFETGARSNNSSSGCGYNASMFYIAGWYSPMPAYAGDTVNATVFTNCNLLNQTMTVYYGISNSSTYLVNGNWSWTAMSLNDTHYLQVANIPAGTYTMTASVYYGSGHTHLTNYSTTITVLANSSGGGGNQTSPCGSNVNYTSVYAYAPYMMMENQSSMAMMYVNCEILNATMVLDYSIINSNNSTVYSGNLSWTGTSSSSSNYTWNLSGLSAGYYTFTADLYVDGTWVDNDYDSFMVYTNSSGGGGNQTSPGEYIDIDHSGYSWEHPDGLEVWTSGSDVYVGFESGNLAIGDNYSMAWWLMDSASSTVANGNASWTAFSNFSVENETISGLQDGIYTFGATLFDASGSVIASDYTTIQMGNSTNNSGGTGSNATGTVAVATTVSSSSSGVVVGWWVESSDLTNNDSYRVFWRLFDNTTNATVVDSEVTWVALNNFNSE
ncbi:MAG: hypothetical protein QF531_04945, partial [Candidatus Poseidonia sp.]|nr:hypothetical protein [Poseidonia sp.]